METHVNDSKLDSYPKSSGKVRDMYDLGDELLLVTSDRISAFDSILSTLIPNKGPILNQMSAFWFTLYKDVCPNHLISINDRVIAERIGEARQELSGRTTLAKKAKPLVIECVVRGYISGSLFKEYKNLGSDVHDLNLPLGLVESEQLPEPIFTPATKAQTGHDENISFAKACDLVGRETAHQVRNWSLELYCRAAGYASSRGIILADTKFEFGETPDGLIWIDEALTPDSSRYWDARLYLPGQSQPSFDKQFVRDYLESTGWNKQPPAPALPPEVVERTQAKYREAFDRIVGA